MGRNDDTAAPATASVEICQPCPQVPDQTARPMEPGHHRAHRTRCGGETSVPSPAFSSSCFSSFFL